MSLRRCVLSSTAIVAAVVTSSPAFAQTRSFDIPSLPAIKAIPELARQAQVQIIAAARDLQGVNTPAVKGAMDTRAALRRMIAGTPLHIVSDDGQIITLRSEKPGGGSTARGAKGSLRGRVLNAATGEYLQNAEVDVTSANISVYTAEDGSFRIPDMPTGPVDVVVRYTGLKDYRSRVTVMSEQATVLDVEMAPQGLSANAEKAITVVGERSGQAAALMKRRSALNAVTAVDADNFGALTMGDVGEFLKNMPGISLDYVEVDTNAVRIGGLDPKYSIFTTDGARMATATSNNNAGRQNSFEQMSITGISRIELNNTLSASMDADAPGGSVNLVSKYAFERKKRMLQVQIGAIGTSDSHLGSTYMPDDKKHATIFPSAQVSFGNVYLGGRLGVALSTSYNANFVEQDRVQTDWSYLPNGTIIPYRLMYRPGPKFTHREAINGAIDYKISDKLTLSLRGTYSFYDVEYFNQYTYLNFGTTTKSYVTADSTATHIVVPANGTNTNVTTSYSHRYAGTPAMIYTPKLNYKDDRWDVTVRGSYSSSEYNFRDGSKGFFQRNDTKLSGIGFTLDRASTDTQSYSINQTSGPSWSNPANWTSVSNSVRSAESNAIDQQYGGNLDIKRKFDIGRLQATVLTGGGIRTNDWRTNEGSYDLYNYTGPGTLPATSNYQFGIVGYNSGNINQLGWRADSNYGAYTLSQQHPEYFTPDTVGNLTRDYQNNNRVRETVTAGYIELQAKLGKLKADLGLRYEGTHDGTQVAQIRTAAQVKAAGYSTSTVTGINYQYYNGQQLWKTSDYGDWFLSGGLKYDFNRHLVAQFAFSQSILRPDYGNLGGAISTNDSTQIATVPNPLLKPEHSTKYYASLQYYLEPSGIIALSGYRLDVKDMQVTGITIDPADAGYSGSDYAGYTFVSTINQPGISRTYGVTGEYDQQLVFLPGLLKGLGLRGSVTWVDPDGVRVNLPKYSANWGLRYGLGPIDIQLTGNYQSSSRTSALSNTETTANNGILYHAARTLWNVSATWNVSPKVSLQVAGRNIFNAPDIIYSNIRSRVEQYSSYGSMWNAAVRMRF
ncbi:TonB-dependent receptor [Novosphingobium sp.]|uniref:TonB-dependent receptor domain-containing protein n=1 Tax=Novosphingobium sp. TaxID=1874826 RepID=UPI0031CEEC35